MDHPISRRSVLKTLGVAVGSAAVGARPSPAGAALLRPSGSCYIYLDHAARNHSTSGQWVVGALLVLDPRLPRQILHRAKRHRLSSDDREVAETTARQASSAFKQYFYRRLGASGGLKKRPLVELYGIRASHAVLDIHRDKVGLFQLRMVQALLGACDLGRFREVFVYYNLPSLHQVSEEEFRAGLLQGVRHGKGTSLEVWEHASVWSRPDGALLVDEGIQVADFVTYALYQKYQHGSARWYSLIRPRIRREINAAVLLRLLTIGG